MYEDNQSILSYNLQVLSNCARTAIYNLLSVMLKLFHESTLGDPLVSLHGLYENFAFAVDKI